MAADEKPVESSGTGATMAEGGHTGGNERGVCSPTDTRAIMLHTCSMHDLSWSTFILVSVLW